MLLKRYWFIVFPEAPYGPKNFGATAYSIEHAQALITKALISHGLQVLIPNWNDNNIEVIENIDIRLLDQGHVIPNMGMVTFEGVWFPWLKM